MDASQIDKWVAAHGMWKARLNTAIENGKLDVPAATVRLDNYCDFGKWLYGASIPDGQKQTEHYTKVKALHADFHKAAAAVAALAEAGKPVEARNRMGGEFAKVSSQLTLAMTAWKKSLS
ncbi:MAG: CZB domain-containing protein [Bryobacteraceae bacterium]